MSNGPAPLAILVDRKGLLSAESSVPIVIETLKEATLTDKAAARAGLGLGEIATMTMADVIAAVRDALNGKEF